MMSLAIKNKMIFSALCLFVWYIQELVGAISVTVIVVKIESVFWVQIPDEFVFHFERMNLEKSWIHGR